MPLKSFSNLSSSKHFQWVSFVTALVLIFGISYVGTVISGYGNAAKPLPSSTPAVNTMVLSPSSGTVAAGSDLSIALRENSGTEALNVVQAKLDYDPALVQYVSITEGTAFNAVVATDTSTAGIVRLARSNTVPQTGEQTVAVVNFRVTAIATGAVLIGIDPASSYMVRSSDNQNILTSVFGANFNIGTANGNPTKGNHGKGK